MFSCASVTVYSAIRKPFFFIIKRELNLTVKYVTFNHSNMSSNLIALNYFTRYQKNCSSFYINYPLKFCNLSTRLMPTKVGFFAPEG